MNRSAAEKSKASDDELLRPAASSAKPEYAKRPVVRRMLHIKKNLLFILCTLHQDPCSSYLIVHLYQ
jgi:hypothetical protein